MTRVFASLALPNYRRYFAGSLSAAVGSWMSRTAQTWLVLVELTRGDMNAIGTLTGLMFLPSLLLSPLGGVLADRFPKRRIMMASQGIAIADAAVLGTLVLTGTIQLWHVFALTIVDGIADALASPARMAFVSELVPAESLPNAIGLNSASFNGARLLGPGLAGLLIALVGTGVVLMVTMATYVVWLLTTALLDASKFVHTDAAPRGRGGVRVALGYVRERPDLLLLLGVGFMVGNFGFNFAITNPIMSRVVFGKGPSEFGLLGSLMGVGALTAALLSAARRTPRLRYIVASLAGYVVCQGLAGVAPTFETFALLQVPLGWFCITALVTANTLLQTSVADEMRGRVMALWMMLLLGLTPVVGPLVGWIGTTLGPRWTVQFGTVSIALTFLVVTGYLVLHDGVRLSLQWSARRPLVVKHPGDEPLGRR